MARRVWSREVRQAARVLFREGFGATAAARAFGAGEAGLGYPVTISVRTLEYWWRGFREEGERAEVLVSPGEEEAAENAIYRQFLSVAKRVMRDLEGAADEGSLTSQQAQVAKTLFQVVDARISKRKARERLSSGGVAQAVDSAARQSGSSSEVLSRIAELEGDG